MSAISPPPPTGHLLDRAETAEDLDQAKTARPTVLARLRELDRAPFLYRKVGESAVLRELIVPFGGSRYGVLHEVIDTVHVDVLALRHQLEDDYH